MSKKVKLIKFTLKHITREYIDWLNDANLLKYSENRHYKHSYETCLKYYESFIDTSNLFYAVTDIKTKEHVGNINAYIDTFNKVADIGILISKGNMGYGFSAWEIMIKKLFHEKNIRKVTAGTMANNYAMIKIFKKAGMKKEYVKNRQFIFNNREIDFLGYCIFNK